jgi:hypothetical protein
MLAQLTKDLFKFYVTPAAIPLNLVRLTSDAARRSVGYNVEIHGPTFIETCREIISVGIGTHLRFLATILEWQSRSRFACTRCRISTSSEIPDILIKVFAVSPNLYLSTYLSIYLSIYLSTYIPTYLSIYLSIYLSVQYMSLLQWVGA